MGTALYPLMFGRTDLAASLTDSPLAAGIGGASEYLIPYDGDIVAASVVSNATRTGGSATFEVRLNGSKLASPVPALDATNTLRHQVIIGHGVRSVKAGDRIEVVVTTDAAWAPITADVTALVWLIRGSYQP